ncbi:MAG: HEAT repeat domain-containing protein [Planctomycetota bacterium]|jgi:HEAT repeat protein
MKVSYDDEAKQMMVRLHERLSPEVAAELAAEVIRLGPEALKLLLRFPEPLVYAAVRRWIAGVAAQMPRDQAVPVLIEALSHPDWRIYQIARDALSAMGTEVRDTLAENLSACPSPDGRGQTLWCLHRLADPLSPLGVGDGSLVPAIAAAAAEDESETVRAAAVEALSRCEAPDAEAAIVRALEDPSDAVRLSAARAAGRLRATGAVAGLVALLEHDDPDARADVIYALDRIGDPRAAGPVCQRLADPDWYVRWAAAGALGNLPSADNVGPLRQATADPHPLVAAAAQQALAEQPREPRQPG